MCICVQLLLYEKKLRCRKWIPCHLDIDFFDISPRSCLARALLLTTTLLHILVKSYKKGDNMKEKWRKRREMNRSLGYRSRSNASSLAISRFLRRDRFRFLCWTRARGIVNLAKENPCRKREKERKKRKREVAIRRGTHGTPIYREGTRKPILSG